MKHHICAWRASHRAPVDIPAAAEQLQPGCSPATRPPACLVKGDVGQRVEEAGLEVGHHRGRLGAQRQDLQQRGVGHKVEARELGALGLCRGGRSWWGGQQVRGAAYSTCCGMDSLPSVQCSLRQRCSLEPSCPPARTATAQHSAAQRDKAHPGKRTGSSASAPAAPAGAAAWSAAARWQRTCPPR